MTTNNADEMDENGIALVRVGRVSVLVFKTAEMRASIGKSLVDALSHITRISIADDTVTDAEVRKALDASHTLHPAPPNAV